jgi:hypothetical protein
LIFVTLFTVATLADKKLASFLVLSEAARKHREEALRERKWTLAYFVGSALAATVAGVLSRYIFAHLFH